MKHLYLIRHAKSDWKLSSDLDFDRPINERGRKNALDLGQLIHDKNHPIQAIYSSPAKRANTTAELILSRMLTFQGTFKLIPELYLPSLKTLNTFVQALSPALNHVVIVGHNPSTTEFIRQFASNIEAVKTASITTLMFDSEDWLNLSRKKIIQARYTDHHNWQGQELM